jgi:hypothetical protein
MYGGKVCKSCVAESCPTFHPAWFGRTCSPHDTDLQNRRWGWISKLVEINTVYTKNCAELQALSGNSCSCLCLLHIKKAPTFKYTQSIPNLNTIRPTPAEKIHVEKCRWCVIIFIYICFLNFVWSRGNWHKSLCHTLANRSWKLTS